MLSLRRKAVQSASKVRATRKYSSDHSHGHGHAEPQTESLGTPFIVGLAALPVTIGIYTISRPSTDGTPSGFSNLLTKYSDLKGNWVARNTLHTEALERAAFDRNVIQSAPGSAHVELRFPELFNSGSPYNVVAGQGPRDMDKLVAHYQKQRNTEDERRVKDWEARALEATTDTK